MKIVSEMDASRSIFAAGPTHLRCVLASCRLRRLGRHSSSRTRTSEERLLGLPQGRDGLLTSDGREILEELGQGLPALEVIEQRRERCTSANEHGRATHDYRIAANRAASFGTTPGCGDRLAPVYSQLHPSLAEALA